MSNLGEPVRLSETGHPKFDVEEEIQHCSIQHVDLYNNETKVLRNGTAIVTTHKAYWLSQDAIDQVIEGNTPPSTLNFTPGYCWNLNEVQELFDTQGLFKTPKVCIKLLSGKVIRFSFKHKGKHEFYQWITTSLERKSWLSNEPKRDDTRAAREPVLGIAGLIQRRQMDHKEEEQFSEQAFSDLNTLIQNARKAVELAQRYSEETSKKTESNSDNNEFANLTENLGLTNIVTRETSGSRYYTQLARQIADFIKKFLERSGGMMTVTDVYCLYNRARGTHLISPKDLWKACSIMSGQNLGITLKKLESGTSVLQTDSHDEEAKIERILSLLCDYTDWISAAELATRWHIPLEVAKHHLLIAEKHLQLCRDDSIAGIRFYKNIFLETELS